MAVKQKPWLGALVILGLWLGWKYLEDNPAPPNGFRFGTDGLVAIPSSPQISREAIDEINRVRAKYARKALIWSDRAYQLALARAKDMNAYNYYDHMNPITGSCPDTIKSQFGFNEKEFATENLNAYYAGNGLTVVRMTDSISAWMGSRGHRFNLLYPNHQEGAIACELNKCVFIAINPTGFGSGCSTAVDGQKFWQNAPLQKDEVVMR